jgi:hypothetical protein
MEQCYPSYLVYDEVDLCPELIFENGRYWCNLFKKKPHTVKHLMGTGCGAPWNKWRESVKKRTLTEYKKYYDEEALVDLVTYHDSKRKKKKN